MTTKEEAKKMLNWDEVEEISEEEYLELYFEGEGEIHYRDENGKENAKGLYFKRKEHMEDKNVNR